MRDFTPHKSSRSRRQALWIGLCLTGIAALLVLRADWTPTERLLAKVLSLQGRHSDAMPHRLSLLELDRIDVPVLILLALGDTANVNPEQMHEYAAAAPNDAGSVCGMAHLAVIEKLSSKQEPS